MSLFKPTCLLFSLGILCLYHVLRWSRDDTQLLAVIVPFAVHRHRDVLEALERWSRFPPCSFFQQLAHLRADLVFYINSDFAHYPGIQRAISSGLGHHGRCFRRVHFISAQLEPSKDTYPDGTTMMFFNLFSHPAIIRDDRYQYGAFFWMEPDVHPIRHSWLCLLELEALSPDHSFWVKGSLQRQPRESDTFLAQAEHLNGNALYSLQDPQFIDLVNLAIDYYSEDPDTVLHSFDISLWIVMRHVLPFGEFTRHRHRYRPSPFIQNHYVHPVNATNVMQDDPDTVFIHGRHVLY
jgi:hypothetical protein